MIDSESRSRKPLQRVAGPVMATAEAVFKAAMVLLVPEDQTQRKAFETLMPYMYVLRNKGASWEQLTKILKDCGFNLQTSTVRSYYSELLASRLDICQGRMNDQILLMAEVRKETKGTDVSAIAGRVAAIMEQQKTLADPKIDSIFGLGSAASPAHGAALRAAVPTTPPEGKPPQPKAARPQSTPSAKAARGSAQFSDDHGAPAIPQLQPAPAPAPAPTSTQATAPAGTGTSRPSGTVRCKPLQAGIAPLKRKDGVPEAVYQPGELEHPAIPGLMLKLDERLYGTSLELVDEHGEIRLESAEEKRFRIRWRKIVPMTPTMTSESFTKMDESLFKKQ